MAFTGIITKTVAAASIALAGLSGVDVVKKVIAPPAITASAVYGKPVQAGEVISLRWTIHKMVNCLGHQSRVWRGANGFYVVEASRPTALPSTKRPEEYTIPTQIPALAPIGELNLTILGEYNCESGQVPFELGPVLLEIVK